MTHPVIQAIISHRLPPMRNFFLLICYPFPQSASLMKQKFLNLYVPHPSSTYNPSSPFLSFAPFVSAHLWWTAFKGSACGLLLISLSCHSALLSHRLTVAWTVYTWRSHTHNLKRPKRKTRGAPKGWDTERSERSVIRSILLCFWTHPSPWAGPLYLGCVNPEGLWSQAPGLWV